MEHELLPSDTFNQFRLGNTLVRRDQRKEQALKQEVRSILGVSLPARLEGDAAYRVLLDGIPRLPEGWRVDLGDSLKRFRVSGQLTSEQRAHGHRLA